MEATDDITLDSLNLKLSKLAIRNEITTLIRHEISKVLTLNRQLLAEHAILKQRFRDIEKLVCERSERKDGKRNVSKAKTVVSTLEVLEESKRCEVETELKKKRRTGIRRKQAKAIQEVESTSEEIEEDVEIEVLDDIAVQRFSS